MAWVRVLVLVLWPMQAMADEVDDLRALIVAGDIAPVAAAVQAAARADLATAEEPTHMRALHPMFGESSPAMTTFLQHWLAEAPTDPLAMTAMGWHLWHQGLNIRGNKTVGQTYGAALDEQRALELQALDLAQQAVKADPGLVSASDLLLRLAGAVDRNDLIPAELERIMTLHPNRGSLMRVMGQLAPQWGGRPDQVTLVCDRYAGMVTSVPGYDSQTCQIDAAYFGAFWPGPQRDAARLALQDNTNPILDYARLEDATAGMGTAQERIAILEKARAIKELTVAQTDALSTAKSEVNDPDWSYGKEHNAALARAVSEARDAADRDPYSPKVVLRYLDMTYDAADLLGIRRDNEDIQRRLRDLVAMAPYNSEVWARLGDTLIMAADRTKVDLDAIAAAEPYYVNAIVYSNHDLGLVDHAMTAKENAILDPMDGSKTRDISALSQAERARLDQVVRCPLLHQILIKQAICQSRGIEMGQCFALGSDIGVIMQRMQQVLDQGSCRAEIDRKDESLAYSPITITFPPAP